MYHVVISARLFNPGDFKPTAVTVDSLKAFAFFGIGGSLLSSLKSELIPRWHIDPLIWWADIRNHCQVGARDYLMLVQIVIMLSYADIG